MRESVYNTQIKELLNQLNSFNSTLVKILAIRSPEEKFIDEEQAQVLKFAKFNSLFLQWLIMEKFIIIVKNLSELSADF